MTDPFLGLVPPSVTFGGPVPLCQNDNEPAVAERADGFHGLLLRRMDSAYEIVLCHRVPSRSQRVETSDNDTDIIALWRSIGQKVGLPLLAEGPDGTIVQIEPSPWLQTAQRRRGSALRQRRPRFLVRRRVGSVIEVSAAEFEDAEIEIQAL